MCTQCALGYEPSGSCGNGVGQRYSCIECVIGKTFSDNDGAKRCRHCQQCENREVLRPCNTKQDTLCGDCKPGFVMLDGTSVCIACSELQGHDHPGCPDVTTQRTSVHTTTTPTTTPSTTPSVSASVTPSRPSQQPENDQVNGYADSDNSGSWKTLALMAIGVLVLVFVAIAVIGIKRWRKHRKGNNGSGATNHDRVEDIEMPEVMVVPKRNQRVRFTGDIGSRSGESDCEPYDSPTEIEPLLRPSSQHGLKGSKRPNFMRSFSAPAGDTESQQLQTQRNQRHAMHTDIKNKELDRVYQQACLIGKDQKIQDFSYEAKEKVALRLDPEPSDRTHKYWFHFGRLWDIDELILKNFTKKTMAVFDYVGPQGYTVEELLQRLVKMDNPVLLKEVCEHVIKEGKKQPK
ncbi:tumor necrosis factor receptor superfamily member EDAR-like isoform X2 [Ptychodera flava]